MDNFTEGKTITDGFGNYYKVDKRQDDSKRHKIICIKSEDNGEIVGNTYYSAMPQLYKEVENGNG